MMLMELWYEKDSDLLKKEYNEMNKVFPNYRMNKLPDGRICWVGKMNCLQNIYNLVVVYESNYPAWNTTERPLRVFVYCDHLTNTILNYDIITGLAYSYVENRGEIHIPFTIHTTSAIAHAIKWCQAYDLLTSGELTLEEFNNGMNLWKFK